MIKKGNWRYLKNRKLLIHTDENNKEYEVDVERKISDSEWSIHFQETKQWSDPYIKDFFDCLDMIKKIDPMLPIFTTVNKPRNAKIYSLNNSQDLYKEEHENQKH